MFKRRETRPFISAVYGIRPDGEYEWRKSECLLDDVSGLPILPENVTYSQGHRVDSRPSEGTNDGNPVPWQQILGMLTYDTALYGAPTKAAGEL